MDWIHSGLWFALGTVAALLIYDYLMMPGIRQRVRREVEAELRAAARGRSAQGQPEIQKRGGFPPPPPPAPPRIELGPPLEPEVRVLTPVSASAPTPDSGERTPPPGGAAPAAAFTLLLVRHGEAGPAASDEARELTQNGRRAVRMLSAELQSKTVSPVAIRTSPLRRAHQTAEIIFSALPDPGPVLPTTTLASGAAVEGLVRLLRAEKPGSVVIWVGHMPELGRFAARLLGQPGEVALKAGAAAALKVDVSADPPSAALEWAWNP